jgi:uncharacterized membrane protein YfcA
MEILGYTASIFIGIALSLTGGGGSILTVPVLVYLMKVQPIHATAYSLFIVGVSSLVGTIPKIKQKLISYKAAVVFGIPSIVAVFVTRYLIVPSIPEIIIKTEKIMLTKNNFLMLLFAILMVLTSISMIKDKPCIDCDDTREPKFNYGLIVVEGSFVGILTGLVGAGGGFLIIPALVLLSKLSFKKAVGTSLIIITAKSLIGFTGDVFQTDVDWFLLCTVSLASVLGIFVGNLLTKKIKSDHLKVSFGWFIFIFGIFIFFKELLFQILGTNI